MNDQENADCLRAYNSFYDGVSKLGRFTLVLDPNEADLVLELHYEVGLGQSVASTQGGSALRQFRVVIEDPHSRIILWSLTERTNYAIRQNNRNKNLDETVATLVSDFNLLAVRRNPSRPTTNPSSGTNAQAQFILLTEFER